MQGGRYKFPTGILAEGYFVSESIMNWISNTLLSGHFAEIESVYIGLDLWFSNDAVERLDSAINLDDVANALHIPNIMQPFSLSMTLRIPIQVDALVTKAWLEL